MLTSEISFPILEAKKEDRKAAAALMRRSHLSVQVNIHVNQRGAQCSADLRELRPRNLFSNQAPQGLAGPTGLRFIRRLHANGNLGKK